MSYRGGRGKSGGGFSVTAEWDGSRSFDEDRRMGGGPRKNYRPRGRGSYRGRGRGYGGFRDDSGPNPRSRFDEDGDISMGDDDMKGSTSRYTPYGGRSNSRRYGSGGSKLAMDKTGNPGISSRLGGSHPRNRRGKGSARNYESNSGWYKVTIPHGAKLEKAVLLQLITNHWRADIPFEPIQFRHEQKSAVFFLNNEKSMAAMKAMSRRITLPSGFKMITVVNPCSAPVSVLNDDTKEKMKVCMSERYDVSTKALNLSSMYQDQKLTADGIRLALNRYNIMSQVVKIIQENIPELTSLDLSNNKLTSLDNLVPLVAKTPNLTHLNLGKNLIRSAEELTKIKGWKLAEIILDGNDLCDHYKDTSAYISAVRKHLPKVLKLDGHELPPPITFDLEATTELPPAKDNFFKNDVLRDLMAKFLREYYEVFDSGNREGLLAAYHDEATFSLTFGMNRMIVGKQPSWPDLQDSRNLFKMKDSDKRQKALKKGRLGIVSFLTSRNFPKTLHDPNSFHVDVNFATNELMMFSVNGIFKEGTGKSDRGPIRAFRRVFSTMSQGGGIVITNDMISITNAGPEQVQAAFKTPAPTPSSSPVLGTAPVQNPLAADGARLAMVQQFSTQSGMNVEWSAKCLEQNEWNFEKAAKIFTELHREGKIPQEAFKQ